MHSSLPCLITMGQQEASWLREGRRLSPYYCSTYWLWEFHIISYNFLAFKNPWSLDG